MRVSVDQFGNALRNQSSGCPVTSASFLAFGANLVDDTGANGYGGLVNYDYSQSAFHLPEADQMTESFHVHVGDGHGGVATQTVVFEFMAWPLVRLRHLHMFGTGAEQGASGLIWSGLVGQM